MIVVILEVIISWLSVVDSLLVVLVSSLLVELELLVLVLVLVLELELELVVVVSFVSVEVEEELELVVASVLVLELVEELELDDEEDEDEEDEELSLLSPTETPSCANTLYESLPPHVSDGYPTHVTSQLDEVPPEGAEDPQ